MPTDGAIAKFLYTILKQLDLKSIDWNNVAGQLDITNGHAARMRFSRFRQQMEGIPPAPRKPRSAVPRTKKPKPPKPPKPEARSRGDDQLPVKPEPEPEPEPEPMNGIEPSVKPEPTIKEEPGQAQWRAFLRSKNDTFAGSFHETTLEPGSLFSARRKP